MEARPLVVLTREERDNAGVAQKLSALGVGTRSLACIETRLVAPGEDVIAALPDAEQLGAVVFTSRRGAEGYGAWLSQAGWSNQGRLPAALLHEKKPLIAAVGDGTANALRELGMEPNLIADPPRGDVLARALLPLLTPRSQVVYIRGNLSVGALEEILRGAGHEVYPVGVYENHAPQMPPLEAFAVSVVFVASPSAVTRLLDAYPWMRSARFVAVGPTTAKACKEAGVKRVTDAGSGEGNWVSALAQAHRESLAEGEGQP